MGISDTTSRTRRFVDIDEQAAELRGFDQAYRQLSRGAFIGEFTTVDLSPQCGIFFETVSRSIESRGSVPADEVALAFILDNGQPVRFGSAIIATDAAVFLNSGAEIDCFCPPAHASVL